MDEKEIKNINAQMRKGMLEYFVFLILRHGKAYTTDIIRQLSNAGIEVVEGTLYTLLNRMKHDGRLAYSWEESREGPPRKYYTLTELGHEQLAVMQSVWNDLEKAHTMLTTPRLNNFN